MNNYQTLKPHTQTHFINLNALDIAHDGIYVQLNVDNECTYLHFDTLDRH